jgi:UDP-2,3-diacylglucosamine pyrophosphatase LpxH
MTTMTVVSLPDDLISDLHLGTAGARAPPARFSRHTESDHLYLVGDIIDGWHPPPVPSDAQRRRPEDPARAQGDARHSIWQSRRVRRHFGHFPRGGIEARQARVAADGRRLLVLHGDLFDAVVQRARWLAIVGDRLHTTVLHLNRWLNVLRARFGFRYWSLARYLKLRVKNAVSYIVDFERAVAAEARRGADGAVRGHIHCGDPRHRRDPLLQRWRLGRESDGSGRERRRSLAVLHGLTATNTRP